MKTWMPRYEQVASLSPNDKLRFYQRSLLTMNSCLIFGIFGGFVVIGLLTAFGVSTHELPDWFTWPLLFSPVAVGIYLALANEAAVNNSARRILNEQWHAPQSLSALIEFSDIRTQRGEYRFRNWAIKNLIIVLPKLQDNEYAALSSSQKRKLYALIMPDAIPAFLLLTIEMLERFADVEALPTIREVATAITFLPEHEKCRLRAQQCVAFLEARVQEKTLEQSLLRGSTANADASHILLRAAAEQNSSEAERHELLRADSQQ